MPLPLYGSGGRCLRILRRGLADELLVDPPHDDLGRLRDVELDPVGRRDRDRMASSRPELQSLALKPGAVAHALDLEAASRSRW